MSIRSCIFFFFSLLFFGTKVFAGFPACVVNNDQTFYRTDLGVVSGSRSFTGNAESMSNWSDASGLSCGTYYYIHYPNMTRSSCVIRNADGTILRNDGAVTDIEQKCYENLPLDNCLPFFGFTVLGLSFLRSRNLLLIKQNSKCTKLFKR